jgi:HlyD family secretion protein
VKLEDGRTFTAKVRSIRSEASFTPYYALAGDDATRLVYRAEVVLQGDGAADLPAGLPVSASVKMP